MVNMWDQFHSKYKIRIIAQVTTKKQYCHILISCGGVGDDLDTEQDVRLVVMVVEETFTPAAPVCGLQQVPQPG